jgi:AcrR family transcriptional regulator
LLAPTGAAICAAMTDPSEDQLDRAAAAALALAAERPWADVTLRDIAHKAHVPLAELYVHAPGKAQVVDWLSRRFNLAALKAGEEAGEDAHDRLFDAAMRRIEAMEPHRAALIAIHAGEGPAPLLVRMPATARAILEGAGVDASGARGALRVVAMTAAWGRILKVWRDDEGALNRTMAEIDRRLKQTRKGLEAVNAGF